jgi:hypothetical protein
MYETILVQELDLPPSGLSRLEDYVPIPKFIPFQPVGLSSSLASAHDPDDSYFHQCHFLAQIANRIILTRIRHSLYLFCEFSFSRVELLNVSNVDSQPSLEVFLARQSPQNCITRSSSGAPTYLQPSNSPIRTTATTPLPSTSHEPHLPWPPQSPMRCCKRGTGYASSTSAGHTCTKPCVHRLYLPKRISSRSAAGLNMPWTGLWSAACFSR